MTEVAETIENIEIFYAVEGHAAHHKAQVHPAITVREFVEIAKLPTLRDQLETWSQICIDALPS